jgi:hypothetical protein
MANSGSFRPVTILDMPLHKNPVHPVILCQYLPCCPYVISTPSFKRRNEIKTALFGDVRDAEIIPDYNGFRGGSNLLILLHHKIILIDQKHHLMM